MSFNNICFILARPQLGENIGFVARALKNFNLTNLRIVNPRCNWPNQEALVTSVGAKNIIRSSKIYHSIEESVADLDIIFASTSRIRKDPFLIFLLLTNTSSLKRRRLILNQ